jgi:uncharacterized protein (TIGR02678 family)
VSGRLGDALEAARADELRRAARALLRRPLLSAGGPGGEDVRLVRRHAAELRSWFDANTGWRLHVDSQLARLEKRSAGTGDATRPASDPRTRQPFSRRRYVLTCLALSVLERSEAQITLGRLADGVMLAAADDELARAGVTFRLEGRDERADLVAVVRLLLSLGVLARVAGDEEAFVRAAGDVLYDVQRRPLAMLLAAPRGPSTIAADLPFDERLTQLSEEPMPDTAEMRNRAIRHALTRTLLDDPVLYLHELGEDEAAYLSGQRAAVTGRVAELTGLVAEIRAEGIAMVDPDDDLTDVRMPESGTDGHATLLVAEHLAARIGAAEPVAEEELRRLLHRLAREHRAYWRRDATQPGAEDGLLAGAIERLEALRLVRREADGVRPLPALGRYALAAPTITGATA